MLEYKITYIGTINIAKDNIRFLYITSYAGNYEDSKRASSCIELYNKMNRMGYYYVGGGFNATPLIFNSNLIIKYDDDYCNQTTVISFKDSIPQDIFIKCTEQGDDIYTFQKEE